MTELHEHDPASARRELLLHGSMYTVAAAAPVLVTVLVTPLVTRMLGESRYGVVAMGMLIVQVGLIALSLGMAEAIARHGILERSGVPGARALVLRGGALSLAVTVVLALTGRWWAPPVTGLQWQPALVAALVGAFLFGVVTNVQAVQRAMGRPGPFVLLSAIASFGGPALGLAVVAGLERSAAGYMVGLVGGYALATVVGLALMRAQGPAHGARGDLARAVRTGAPMIGHQASVYLATGALVVVATHAGGPQAGGRLQLALLVGTAPAIIAMALGNSWGPALYRTPPQGRGAVITATSRDVVAVIAILAGGVSALSPWVLRFLAPPSFRVEELVPVVALGAAGSVVAVAYLANVHIVFARGRSAGLLVIAPLAVAAATAALQAVPDGAPLWVIGAGFPLAYLVMAVAAGTLRRAVTVVRFSERVLTPWVLVAWGSALVGALAPVEGWAALVRLALAVALGVVGLRRVAPFLRGGS